MRHRPDIAQSTDLLVTLLGHAVEASRLACRDLTDAEFFWEPISPCWGIRRRGETDAANVWGTGEWVMEMWGDEPPGVTTIGWRVVHLAAGGKTYLDNTFGTGDANPAEIDVPGGAEAAVALLGETHEAMLVAFASVDDGELTAPTSTHWGEELPLWQLLWTAIVEQFHHGAEIGVLRDLRRGHANRDWWPELQHPQWWPLGDT